MSNGNCKCHADSNRYHIHCDC